VIVLLFAAWLAAAPAPPHQAPPHVDARYRIPPTVIPKTLPAIVETLRRNERDVQALVDGTSTEGLYPPFTRIRDLGVAIEAAVPRLPAARRARASLAAREMVRLAWVVHEAADFGEPAQVRAGLQQLRVSVAETIVAFETAKK
jgi:hypothetical protein